MVKMKKPFVILDDGHGVNTPGKRSPLFEELTRINGRLFCPGDFFKENEFNQPVCNFLEEMFKSAGIECVQVIPSSDDLPLNLRIARENEFFRKAKEAGKSPIFISVHANAYQNTNTLVWNPAHGVETFYIQNHYNKFKTQESKILADLIQREVVKATGLRNRGVKNGNFFVIRNSLSPSVLVEGPFMTNKEEVKLLASPKFQVTFAKAIYEAVLSYYNLKNIE
jgi:N-acetylmuramoyl-L-alanine amidase